jgi:hypothetical protein
MSASDRTIWGPLVWGFFHVLAELSDRKDIYLLWSSMLRVTANILPCDLCRHHMKEYLTIHAFVPKNWIQQTGQQNASQIQHWLHTFHNSVNERLKKPAYVFSEISYKLNTREENIKQAHKLYERLMQLWSNQKSRLSEWRRIVGLLLHLVSAGPT